MILFVRCKRCVHNGTHLDQYPCRNCSDLCSGLKSNFEQTSFEKCCWNCKTYFSEDRTSCKKCLDDYSYDIPTSMWIIKERGLCTSCDTEESYCPMCEYEKAKNAIKKAENYLKKIYKMEWGGVS